MPARHPAWLKVSTSEVNCGTVELESSTASRMNPRVPTRMWEAREHGPVIQAAEKAAEAGNYASAEKLLRQAARLQEASLGPRHPDLANTLNNLGIVCEITDKPDDAEQYFRRAVSIARTSLDADHPFVATSQKNLRDFCEARGKAVEPPAPHRSTTPAGSSRSASGRSPGASSRSPGASSRTPGVSSNRHSSNSGAGAGAGTRAGARGHHRRCETIGDRPGSGGSRSHVEEVLLSGRAWRARTDCHADGYSRCRPPAAWSPGAGRAVTRGRNRSATDDDAASRHSATRAFPR